MEEAKNGSLKHRRAVFVRHKPQLRCTPDQGPSSLHRTEWSRKMKSRLFIPSVIPMFLGLVLAPVFGGQAAAQASATAPNDQEQSNVNTEMMSHQHLMEDLLAGLQKDLQAVVSSRDAYGYIHNKAAVKAYEADLAGLREAVRQHKLFAADYERWCEQSFTTDYEHRCGPDKKQNAMAEHQQQMKSALFYLSDTFYTYLAADDHSIEGGPNKIEDALTAHHDALNDFAHAVKDHEQAMAQMMTTAADHGSL